MYVRAHVCAGACVSVACLSLRKHFGSSSINPAPSAAMLHRRSHCKMLSYTMCMVLALPLVVQTKLSLNYAAHSLSGHHLRIGIPELDFLPFYRVKMQPGQPPEVSGFYADVVRELSDQLDFQYSWVPLPFHSAVEYLSNFQLALSNHSVDVVADWVNFFAHVVRCISPGTFCGIN